jgi:hypothetical protein
VSAIFSEDPLFAARTGSDTHHPIFDLEPPPALRNAEFFQTYNITSKMTVDDTDDLLSLMDTVAVIPKVYGHSVEEGLNVFPPYFFERCSI